MSISKEDVIIKRHKPSTEVKTKMCIVALLTVSALSPTMLGQEKIPAGVAASCEELNR